MMQFDLFFDEAKKAVVEKTLRPKPAPLFALLLLPEKIKYKRCRRIGIIVYLRIFSANIDPHQINATHFFKSLYS